MENMYESNSCGVGCVGCVGYAYVPVQTIADTYDVNNALCRGTVFPELDLTICEYGKICKKVGGTENG